MGMLDIFLSVIIFINLLFSGMVYFHGSRTWSIVFYALTSFFASLWSIATLILGFDNISLEILKFAALLHYVAGDLAFIAIYWFSVCNRNVRSSSYTFPLVLSGISILIDILLVTLPNLFFEFHTGSYLGNRIEFHQPGYAIFVILLSILFFAMLLNLAREYRQTNIIGRLPMRYLLYATSFGGGLGILLNLYFPWFGNFEFFTVSPILVTLFFTGISSYTLLHYRLFNIQVITTELITAVLWIFLLIQTLLAKTLNERLIDGAILALTVFFGVLLVKSVMREIDTRQKIEGLAKELRKANAELARVNQAKSDFLSIASHQLKTPLSIIKGYISMTLEGSFGALNDMVKKQLGRVYISNERLIGLVDDLLNFSRLEEGRMKYDLEEVDVRDIIASVIEEMKEHAAQKHLTVSWTPPSERIPIMVDKVKIRNVIFNLLDNAIKYTNTGTIALRISPKEKQILLEVEDSGRGMSKTELGSIFQKFKRGMEHGKEGSRSSLASGFGLGLYIARLVVLAHKGNIWATSPGEGKGSTFFVSLPVAKDTHIADRKKNDTVKQ